MNYANRDTESIIVERLLLQGKTPIIIKANHASGITSFIKEKLSDIIDSRFGTNVFYIDAAASRPLSELMFRSITSSDYLQDLQSMADRELGNNDKFTLSAVLEGLPYVGPAFGKAVERRSAIPVYSGAYSSVMEELLVPFFEKYINNGKHLIIIDAVEMLPEESFDFLVSLMRSSALQIILIKTADIRNYDKLENYLFNHQIDISSQVGFDRPQIKLVKELGLLYGIEISEDHAKSILQKNKQNIHAIIKEIRNVSCNVSPKSLSAWEETVLSIINIWTGEIEESTLIEITTQSEVFAFDNNKVCQEAIRSLNKKGLIELNQTGWMISSRHDPQVEKVLSDFSSQLINKNIVYNYLLIKNNGLFNVELRYYLGKELNCLTVDDSRQYLRFLLLSGKDVPSELMTNAKLSSESVEDCLMAGVKYCRERRFEEALMWINSIPDNRKTYDIRAFQATLFNRTRRSADAEKGLLECLDNIKKPASQNILSAFLVSTYIHMEDIIRAQQVYEKYKPLHPYDSMHGYLVRNATSAYTGYNEDMFQLALSDFRRDGDDFGYYTTLCNQGHALSKEGKLDRALTVLNEAKEGLERLSKVNLHIIYNDLGLCYLLLNKYREAYRYLLLANQMSKNPMPRIFSSINIACTEALMGKKKEALSRLVSIEKEVADHTLDRVRQKYYINRLLIEYLNDHKNIASLIEKAQLYPDRYYPEQTQRAVRFYQNYIESTKTSQPQKWQSLFSPCGLAYWYMDPLKLFPTGII